MNRTGNGSRPTAGSPADPRWDKGAPPPAPPPLGPQPRGDPPDEVCFGNVIWQAARVQGQVPAQEPAERAAQELEPRAAALRRAGWTGKPPTPRPRPSA